jgi:hypothetical protein
MKKLDAEMKKTDLLLYQMIPKKIADRLRGGEKAANLCEVNIYISFFFSFWKRNRITSALSIDKNFIFISNNQSMEMPTVIVHFSFCFRHLKVVQFYSVMLLVLHQYVQHLHQWKLYQFLMKCIQNLINVWKHIIVIKSKQLEMLIC